MARALLSNSGAVMGNSLPEGGLCSDQCAVLFAAFSLCNRNKPTLERQFSDACLTCVSLVINLLCRT